jgi:hypothetical protein
LSGVTITKSEETSTKAATVDRTQVALSDLSVPAISRRDVFPARHSISSGLSPWKLSRDTELRAALRSLTWTIVAYSQTTPVGDGSIVATETQMLVDVIATKFDGTEARMSNCECVLRTELDGRSLADRQLTGQGWLLPIGYTVVVDTPIA